MKLLKNKRGNVFDPLIIIIVLFGFALAAVLFLLISSDMKDKLTDLLDSPTSHNAITATYDAIKTFDYIFVILVSMLVTSTLISAFFIKSHPIFFIINTILLFVFMIPAVVLSNTFEKYEGAAKIAPLMTDFPLISYFMDKLPWVLAIAMVLMFVVLFMYKGGGSSGGQYYE